MLSYYHFFTGIIRSSNVTYINDKMQVCSYLFFMILKIIFTHVIIMLMITRFEAPYEMNEQAPRLPGISTYESTFVAVNFI